ncbi:class II histone deacetylase complex subunits 2 and 3-domain-containing protein [Rhexocercosporidium sp. MPI-PUGE-AT-0058]|nr:class II histone deacetylase complex subunits 2 and 3-domain-containing protein [Rhexocercosporidium sp. MPI-PUGE-AT-0058]
MYRRDMPSRRVGESSSRTPKRRRSFTSTPSDRTPSSSARRSGKKTKVKQEAVEAFDDVEYPARAILEQESRKGTIWYLIDWEDNRTTGEKYEPTWEPHTFVTPDLKAEWENKQLKERRVQNTVSAAEVPRSPNNSKPIRPAKRRKLFRKGYFAEEGARGATREPEPEFDGSQTVSQEAGLQRLDREIPDSYEEEGEQSTSRIARVGSDQARVEIGVPQDFDPCVYTVYNNISSSSEANPEGSQGLDPQNFSDLFQSSQTSHSKANEVSSQPAQSSSAQETQPRQLSQTAYIWDEDIDEDFGAGENQCQISETPKSGEVAVDPVQSSAPVHRSSQVPFIWDSDIEDLDNEEAEIEESEALEVPDSQEPRGSSSYKPSETPSSKTDTSFDSATRINTQTNTEPSLEAIESRDIQWPPRSSVSKEQDSGSIESQFAQRASFLDQESYTDTPEPKSTQVETAQSQTQGTGGPKDSVSLVDSSTRRVGTEPPRSPAAEIPSSPVLQSQEHCAQLPSQQSPGKISEEDSSIGFLTQLPRVSCEEESGELPLLRDESDERLHTIEDQPNSNVYGEGLEPADKDSPFAQRFEQSSEPISFSNFTDWPASKFLLQSQHHTQDSQPIRTSNPPHSSGRGIQQDPIQIASPQEENFTESEVPASQTANTQKSASAKSSGYSQAPSHLPSPPVEDRPVEDIRPTIEEVEPLETKFSPEQLSSSPIHKPRRSSLSLNMEPTNDPTLPPEMNATALLKAKMAAAKAARASAIAMSKSPTPAVALSNQNAIVLNQTLPAPTPALSEPHALPNLESSTSTPPVPVSEPSIAASVFTAPFEESEPSPTKVAYPEGYPEEEEVESRSLKVMPLGPEMFEVPLPITTYARDIYLRHVKIYRVQLQSFLQDDVLDETLVAEVSALLETLQTICIHPGILDEDLTQKDDYVLKAKWAENVSTKFIFLAEFLELMQATDKHVVIIAQPGKTLDELESLLIYHEIHYSRVDRERQISTSKFKVTLYPAGSQQYFVDPASFVIAFDPSYRTLPYLDELRTHSSSPGVLAPLISLVITNSVEHIERCFDNNLEAVGRLIKVASCIQQLMERVGTFEEEGYLDLSLPARALAEFLISEPHQASWPLLPMPTIDALNLSLMNSQTFSEEQPTYTIPASTQDLQSGIKRPLDTEESDGVDILKRQRLTPSNGELNSSVVSETVPRTASAPTASRFVVSSSEDERAQISSLLQRVSDLESQIRARDATEMLLREINQDLESRCQDYESSIAEIQPKYQEALNERGEYEHEKILAIEREARMKKERDNKYAEVIKLREQNAEMEAELSAAKTALATLAIPEIAEFAKLKEDVANAKLETEREHKRYLSANNDLEYLRSQFQTSSSSAAEHSNELRTLQEQLAFFRERSEFDKVRVHEIQSSNENAGLRQENTELKARLKDLERDFEKKQDELKAVTNGRRATRGTSVPQSPRMGNQNSPSTRPIARVLHSGSRGNSPAPGEVRIPGGGAGPFAGGQFGDVLFMNPPSQRERWGNHLQQ